MINNESLSIITKDLGIKGFALLLFFLLIAIYIKNDSQKKFLIYIFSFLSIIAVLSGIYFQYYKNIEVSPPLPPIPPKILTDTNAERPIQQIVTDTNTGSNIIQNVVIQRTSDVNKR